MDKVDLTYGGKLDARINGIIEKTLDVRYTIDGKTGEVSTTSLLINPDRENFMMITFDYQDLKQIIEEVK